MNHQFVSFLRGGNILYGFSSLASNWRCSAREMKPEENMKLHLNVCKFPLFIVPIICGGSLKMTHHKDVPGTGK